MSFALITGASKGIGKAIAFELAARQNNLLLVARSESLLQNLANEISDRYGVQTDYLALDLASTDAPAQLLKWLNQKSYVVNILVNNAGYGLSGSFENYTAQEHHDMMQVNMQVPVALCSLLIPQLKEQPSAYILNIVSSAAYQAVPGLSVYAASKAFLLSFSRGLRYELRNTSVSVTALSPGATDTDFSSRAKVGTKALKAAEKVNMTPEVVAKIAVTALYARKAEVITGLVNQLGAFLVWLLPKSLVEKSTASLYEMDAPVKKQR